MSHYVDWTATIVWRLVLWGPNAFKHGQFDCENEQWVGKKYLLVLLFFFGAFTGCICIQTWTCHFSATFHPTGLKSVLHLLYLPFNNSTRGVVRKLWKWEIHISASFLISVSMSVCSDFCLNVSLPWCQFALISALMSVCSDFCLDVSLLWFLS